MATQKVAARHQGFREDPGARLLPGSVMIMTPPNPLSGTRSHSDVADGTPAERSLRKLTARRLGPASREQASRPCLPQTNCSPRAPSCKAEDGRPAATIPSRLTYPRTARLRGPAANLAGRTYAQRAASFRGAEPTPEESRSVRRENPNVGPQMHHRRRSFAARFLLLHDTDKWACNSKICYTPISALDRSKRKAHDLQAFHIAGAGFEPATFGL